MFREQDFTKLAYKPKDVARLLGVTYQTVRNYDLDGRLKTKRTEGDRRIIMREDLLEYLDSLGLLVRDKKEKRDVLYARISSHEQKRKGDLERQAVFLMEHVSDLQNPVVLQEVGSGLNDNRPKLQKLLKMAMDGEVSRVFVTYKDRLTRFGFNYLKAVFEAHGVELVVVNDERAAKSVEQELTEDMMSLLASFSGRLYGMRSRKKVVEYVDGTDRVSKAQLKKLLAEDECHEWDEGIYRNGEDRAQGSP